MRVPPQRSSRSSTASTTPGKRVSSTSANATSSSSSKKRKLAADAPSSGSKKKKQLRSLKKASPAAVKAVTSAKNKHKVAPLVGLKKIKIKEGRVTIKKILMTTGGTKAQKKQPKPAVKAAKKQVNAAGKKMTSTTAFDTFPTASTSEEQLPDAEQPPPHKKPQTKTKTNVKKVKSVKKPKGPSPSSTVPIPLTRTKKLQQRQKLKPVKKITAKRVPVTRKIMITQKISGGGKKKVATRRKQGSEEDNISTLIVSPSREDQGVETVQSGSHLISVVLQSAPSTSATPVLEKNKGTNKKAKEEEGAIKKLEKKKVVKGKPKMEGSGNGSTSSDNCSESTKDKSELFVVTPKKEGKGSKEDGPVKTLKKTQKVKRPTPKSKATKKSAVVKSPKVISTKLKKLPSPKVSMKKTLQAKKKICPKEEPSDDYESSPKSVDSHGADSSTSDEITLDVLLLRQQQKQQMKQEVLSGAEQNSNPSSPCSSEKPLTTSVKTEASSSSINTSDDEDLKSIKVKLEKDSDSEDKKKKNKKRREQVTRKSLGVKKTRTGVKRARGEKSSGSDTEQRARRMKLFGFWSGPKRHRVASLNALAKVHCLYENEGRGAFLGICASGGTSMQRAPKPRPPPVTPAATFTSTRTLRSAPGLRGMGKHWDMHNASSTSSSSTSSDDTDDDGTTTSDQKTKPQLQQSEPKNKVVKRRRKRNELIMDLKDMVVRKRMASLNASAILAASYSMEKRPAKPMESEAASSGKKRKKKRVSKKVVEVEDDSSSSSDVEVEESDRGGGSSSRSVIEVRDNSNKKVAVIVNQDTDVTITGVYVNSTTRSTHHEGFCSIAGMQYRISSTSHTQTEATAVATETVLHTAAEHPPAEPPLAPPMKSYTPLGALSNMQPPGTGVVGGPPPPHHHHHPHAHPHPHAPPPCTVPPPQQPPPHRPGPVNPGGPISPLGRRHGCTSAFSAPPPPPAGTYGPQPPHHHPAHPPPQGQADPAYIHGYYQPAGPLISTHHHHHSTSSSSSSSIANSGGKVPPAVLEASPNPTPPPSSSSGSVPPPPPTSTGAAPPQQIVSVTPSGGGGGGEESSDNDVIITATSCGGGEVVPPPPPVHPHQGYRYPHQTYPAPQQHHQSYSYQTYPHTQYYPSPPATASIQYSAVATNPHAHYHNQDLCYSSTASYPPASYFHHKTYSTPPPPASYHRRYIPPPQYYSTSDLYSSPASNASQPNSNQSQQSQQMVVTGSGTGSASSYQPSAAPPPPPLVGVSSNPPPPPPLVDAYPPPVSIVDPYAGAPAYYGGYGAGPGAAGCYTHSPPTRSLAFIDAAYQSCPCPMQSCPKNVHTGPLTGDGKGSSKPQQQQQQPVQESGAAFHQLPLPPVALALPLEPPGALGPPSPARGSAGMPPPPSPVAASARNPSQCQEEAAFRQRTWDSATVESQSTLEGKTLVKSKQEPSGQDYVGETQLPASMDVAQDLQLKGDEETTALPGEEAISRHGLLTISKDAVCRSKSRPPASNHVPLLMCDFQKKRQSPVTTKLEEMPIVDSNVAVNNSVKTEVRNMEKEVLVEKKSTGVVQNGSKTVFRNGSSRKRKDVPGSEVPKTETEMSVPKRRKLSTSNVVASKLSSLNPESQKTNGLCDSDDQLAETQAKCKTAQITQPLSSNSCSLHNAKQNARKRKLDDGKDLAENKEPLPVPVKKVQRLQTKIYPSRAKPVKKAAASSESLKKIDEVLDSVVGKERTNSEESKDVPATTKKVPGGKIADRKKETKVNGVLLHQKKPLLRHQNMKNLEDASGYVNGDSTKGGASQTNANRVRMEVKKSQQCNKSDAILSSEELCASGKKSRVNHMLRSHGLRDSLSDRSSSDDAESQVPRGKVGCSSSAMANRRTSTGSRKDQPKKPTSVVARIDHITKKQSHVPGAQDLGSVALMSYARKPAPRKSLLSPKWSNGWKFEGEPFESRVFTANDDMPVMRRCYPLMRHQEGDVICPRDCVLLKSGPRKTDLPFVAKVAALWENPDDGEMMVSLLWYYRPEHTDQGRRADDMEDEIFASKHKDINSVACIEDKCYVLTFNEYCRYRKGVRRLEDGIREPGLVVPQHEDYPRESRQPPGYVAPELVFFCRRVYDYRQRRILKNPG